MSGANAILGRPLWYELMTTDMKAAETFYRTVVGWTSVPFDGAPQPYVMFNRTGDIPVAGLMTMPDDLKAPPFWAMYVGVPELEAAAAHIERLGGATCSPVIEVPNVGRMQDRAQGDLAARTAAPRRPRHHRTRELLTEQRRGRSAC